MSTAPYCAWCGRKLTSIPGRVNSVHLVQNNLSCPHHERNVRTLAQNESRLFLTEKGKEAVQTGPCGDDPIWLVAFPDENMAIQVATALAKGSDINVQIVTMNVSRIPFLTRQIVRPSGERIRKSS